MSSGCNIFAYILNIYVHCNPIDFRVQYRQLAASAFAINITGACKKLAGITSWNGVKMDNLKIRCDSSHIPTYVTKPHISLLCPTLPTLLYTALA